MKTEKCCTGMCHQGRDCPARMPSNLGKSQQERDLDALLRRDTRVIAAAGIFTVLALVLYGLLDRVPA